MIYLCIMHADFYNQVIVSYYFELDKGREKTDDTQIPYVENPLVVSILDGSTLRLFLEDEDDFAMLAENLFTDLDVEDKGKISKSEIRNALVQMGVDMGVPPFSGSLLFFLFEDSVSFSLCLFLFSCKMTIDGFEYILSGKG